MNNAGIAQRRLRYQGLSTLLFRTPAEVVRWFGAVQAQDYPASLWAVGLRLPAAVRADVEQAIAKRTIVRTWPMRGTLHLVPAEDVRWMLDLLAARVARDRRRRQVGGDEENLKRARSVLEQALQGGRALTRNEAKEVLERSGVSVEGQRGYHALGILAQEGLICLGGHHGKQPTFVLLDEWVPHQQKLSREEALGELAKRYFRSHGPATAQDFAWWSGLRMADVRAATELAGPELASEEINGKRCWYGTSLVRAASESHSAWLLPSWDEYLVAYRDRSAVLDGRAALELSSFELLGPTVVIDGRVVGTWKAKIDRNGVVIEARALTPWSEADTAAVEQSVRRYDAFLGGSETTSLRVTERFHR